MIENTVHSNQVYDFLRHTNQFLTLFSGHTNKVFASSTQVFKYQQQTFPQN